MAIRLKDYDPSERNKKDVAYFLGEISEDSDLRKPSKINARPWFIDLTDPENEKSISPTLKVGA